MRSQSDLNNSAYQAILDRKMASSDAALMMEQMMQLMAPGTDIPDAIKASIGYSAAPLMAMLGRGNIQTSMDSMVGGAMGSAVRGSSYLSGGRSLDTVGQLNVASQMYDHARGGIINNGAMNYTRTGGLEHDEYMQLYSDIAQRKGVGQVEEIDWGGSSKDARAILADKTRSKNLTSEDRSYMQKVADASDERKKIRAKLRKENSGISEHELNAKVDTTMEEEWGDKYDKSVQEGAKKLEASKLKSQHVTKAAKDELTKATQAVAETINNFGDLIGETDITVIKNAAKSLGIGDATTRSGATELDSIMREANARAAMTGTSTQEQLLNMGNVNSSMAMVYGNSAYVPRSATEGGVNAGHNAGKGGGPGSITTEEGTAREVSLRAAIADENKGAAILAYNLDKGLLGEDSEKAQALLDKLKTASPKEAKAIQNQINSMAYKHAGKENWNDKKYIERTQAYGEQFTEGTRERLIQGNIEGNLDHTGNGTLLKGELGKKGANTLVNTMADVFGGDNEAREKFIKEAESLHAAGDTAGLNELMGRHGMNADQAKIINSAMKSFGGVEGLTAADEILSTDKMTTLMGGRLSAADKKKKSAEMMKQYASTEALNIEDGGFIRNFTQGLSGGAGGTSKEQVAQFVMEDAFQKGGGDRFGNYDAGTVLGKLSEDGKFSEKDIDKITSNMELMKELGYGDKNGVLQGKELAKVEAKLRDNPAELMERAARKGHKIVNTSQGLAMVNGDKVDAKHAEIAEAEKKSQESGLKQLRDAVGDDSFSVDGDKVSFKTGDGTMVEGVSIEEGYRQMMKNGSAEQRAALLKTIDKDDNAKKKMMAAGKKATGNITEAFSGEWGAHGLRDAGHNAAAKAAFDLGGSWSAQSEARSALIGGTYTDANGKKRTVNATHLLDKDAAIRAGVVDSKGNITQGKYKGQSWSDVNERLTKDKKMKSALEDQAKEEETRAQMQAEAADENGLGPTNEILEGILTLIRNGISELTAT